MYQSVYLLVHQSEKSVDRLDLACIKNPIGLRNAIESHPVPGMLPCERLIVQRNDFAISFSVKDQPFSSVNTLESALSMAWLVRCPRLNALLIRNPSDTHNFWMGGCTDCRIADCCAT